MPLKSRAQQPPIGGVVSCKAHAVHYAAAMSRPTQAEAHCATTPRVAADACACVCKLHVYEVSADAGAGVCSLLLPPLPLSGAGLQLPCLEAGAAHPALQDTSICSALEQLLMAYRYL